MPVLVEDATEAVAFIYAKTCIDVR